MMTNPLTPAELAAQRRKDCFAYGTVLAVGVVGAILAGVGIAAAVDGRVIAAVAGVFVVAASASKLLASAEDVSGHAKDRLKLINEVLLMYGGSAGLLSVVTALVK